MAEDKFALDTLRQLLGIQGELRTLAENRWQRAQRELVSLLERVDPEEVDRRLKGGQALDSLGVEDLVQLIGRPYSTILRQAKAAQKEADCSSKIQPLRDEIQDDHRQIEKMRMEIRRLEEENHGLRAERDGTRSLLASLQQIPEISMQKPLPHPDEHSLNEAPQNEDAPEPDWMAAWRKMETFERDAAVLRLLGETGLARRPQMELRLDGSVQDTFSRLEALGLIEYFRPWDPGDSRTGSPSADLARLAERGRFAYMLLTGTSPVQNEYDALLVRNVSPEHILLYLHAADILREAIHQVNPSPPEVRMPDGSLFKPDLQAIDPKGQTLYIEVEAEANQNREQRLVKWRKALQVGGGQIYIFCDNPSCMHSIRSEINFRLGRQAEQCYLTNLADLKAGKRAADGGIWLEVRPDPATS